MSNLLPQSNSNALSAQIPETFTRAEGKELSKLQNREVARGLVAGTRVQAAGMVAALGMQTTAMLGREATFQADGDPVAINRLNHIVDTYAMVVGHEVNGFRS
ncbi:hypothetical protein D4768_21385 [Rhodococcus erythropolis]|uniref:hypothetical protein n=1 Tax=Rhodococcus erythropolis TaxID=1833 RepID=UPI001F492A88|nr:hypothetical protein [Rhodococcus erythropolis]UJC79947.1 hypothetical protein D4768_21385 [Rhodococcus erythropolis]